jgi:hypothetical protein
MLLFLFLWEVYPAQSQELTGIVYVADPTGKTPLPGVTVRLSVSKTGAVTGRNGTFSLRKETSAPEYLIVSFVGFQSDSVLVDNATAGMLEFVMTEGVQLSEAVVTAHRQGVTFSTLSAGKTELITSAGLTKMACCNLSESFENSATVTVGFTDAVSGAKQVQLLGLSGIYSQMLAENVPTMRGLAATYGWNYTPGTWLESIQISKGASSVVNGYESVTGQINLEFKKPNLTESLFINLYTDDARRYEGNLTSAVQVNKHLWTGLMLHGSTESKVHDANGDTFLDQPKTKFINAYNRWFYLNDEAGIQSRTGLKFLYEERIGGQDSVCHKGEGALYQTFIHNKNFTVYNKTGVTVGDREGQSLGIIHSFTYHDQESDFGMKNFGGTQVSFYSNIMFTSFVATPAHHYTVGVSFSYDRYRTHFLDSLTFNQTPYTRFTRTESTPGLYGEYTYSPSDAFSVILGLRTDHNSRFGWLVTPRSNIRYNIGEYLILRASAGRGFRSPNVLSENIGLMGSSRQFDLSGVNGLDMESAWNYGGNVTLYIPLWDKRRAMLSLDYFRTDFQHQAIVDTERDRHAVFFYNLRGRSRANAWQADLSMTFFRGLDLFAAFRYSNNRITYTQENVSVEVDKPLVST